MKLCILKVHICKTKTENNTKILGQKLVYSYSHSHKQSIFGCYEVKIEEIEKAGSCRESNPGHLA